jgi:hypothetical protein
MTEGAFEARLAKLKREVKRELRRRFKPLRPRRASSAPRRAWWQLTSDDVTTATIALAKGLLIVALPFLVYVRGSVELYDSGVTPWLAVFGGALLTLGVVVGIAAWISRRYSGRARVLSAVRWVVVPIIVVWCAVGVFRLSGDNVKSEDVRAYFSQVHPVLRVALATAILADPDMMVTDLGRVGADYPRMGLPVNDRTKHYRQSNGWVHAVDLRTRERGEIRNRLLQFYFWTMGFYTLRHVGTADHLHVQLAVRE